MLNKLAIIFCIISWVVIIPYMMFDINTTLDHCQELTKQIQSYDKK